MKWRCASPLLLLLLAACGSGGGPATTTVAILVTPMKSPVLVTYTSNTVRTAFPSAASIPDGTQLHFTASSPNVTLIPPTVTVAGGVATVRVKSSAPGKYPITATSTVGSTVYTGNTTVTFIDQPATVQVYIVLQPVVNNLAGLQFTLQNDPGISAFQNISSFNTGFFPATNLSPGQAPPNNRTNVGAISASGIDITSNNPLFRLTYDIVTNGGLPGFAVDPPSILAISANGGTIMPAPTVLINWKYDTDTF